MDTVLYFPTRYFPAISGAELYFQRMAEILSSKYDYKVDIRTSNAIDFKALRNPKGRTIHDLDKYYSKVNKMRLHRYNVNYDCSMEEKIKSLNAIDHYRSLNLPDSCLKMFLHNGPFLSEIIKSRRKNCLFFSMRKRIIAKKFQIKKEQGRNFFVWC